MRTAMSTCGLERTCITGWWNHLENQAIGNILFRAMPTVSTNPNAPFILWLQGGPGASGIGFGCFGEIGPLNISLQPRATSWTTAANLLFIDSPVGAGYSYVDDLALLPKDNAAIAKDVVTLLTNLSKSTVGPLPKLSSVPFYIFCESYGGKMAVSITTAIFAAIDAGSLKLDFKGIALGDSWIDGISYVDTWAPFLRATSLMSEHAKTTIVDPLVAKADAAVAQGDWSGATNYWAEVENGISSAANNVNFYNILQWSCEPLCATSAPVLSAEHAELAPTSINRTLLSQAFSRRIGAHTNNILDDLMNGPIRQMLGDVSPKVTSWAFQSGAVFSTLSPDFMKPVLQELDTHLASGRISIVVYEGQVDLICGSMGAEMWMNKLKWSGLSSFLAQPRAPFYVAGDRVNPAGFRASYKTLSLFQILKAGHMVPTDQGEAALLMVKQIVG